VLARDGVLRGDPSVGPGSRLGRLAEWEPMKARSRWTDCRGVSVILGAIGAGLSEAEILEEYPTLNGRGE
jgi:hypothetical protein